MEIKLLLSPASIQSAIASLDFGKQSTSRVDFFDTDNLSLLAQGVIVRVRQGAKNDLTVKVRVPEGNQKSETPKLRESSECEIDRTDAGANISYSVGEKYDDRRVPLTGNDLFSALSSQQRKLLEAAHVSIDWQQVKRISSIHSTTWKTSSNSQIRKLTLEYWEFPAGSLLELSTRSSADEWKSTDEDLRRLVKGKGLSLSPDQQMKTTTVLKASRPGQSPHE